MAIRHFLTLQDINADEFRQLIQRASQLKIEHRQHMVSEPTLRGKVLAMIFEKASTRTRVSFEAGMAQLGGHALFLSSRDTQLGRGEPVEDAAKVISSMVDVVMIRTFDHATVEQFAVHSQVPVINALTDDYHPCQLLADMQCFFEQRGDIQGKTVAWVGDGNNMCHSYMNAAALLGFQLNIACPPGFEPKQALLEQYQAHVSLSHDPAQAVQGAHLVATDVWASMGQEDEQRQREQQFAAFQVNPALMDLAAPDAIFMHCLPAHRGEEVSDDMLDDPRSVVFDEAENRLHAQKALLEFLLS